MQYFGDTIHLRVLLDNYLIFKWSLLFVKIKYRFRNVLLVLLLSSNWCHKNKLCSIPLTILKFARYLELNDSSLPPLKFPINDVKIRTLGGPTIVPIQSCMSMSSSSTRPHEMFESPTLRASSNSSSNLKFLGTTYVIITSLCFRSLVCFLWEVSQPCFTIGCTNNKSQMPSAAIGDVENEYFVLKFRQLYSDVSNLQVDRGMIKLTELLELLTIQNDSEKSMVDWSVAQWYFGKNLKTQNLQKKNEETITIIRRSIDGWVQTMKLRCNAKWIIEDFSRSKFNTGYRNSPRAPIFRFLVVCGNVL